MQVPTTFHLSFFAGHGGEDEDEAPLHPAIVLEKSATQTSSQKGKKEAAKWATQFSLYLSLTYACPFV